MGALSGSLGELDPPRLGAKPERSFAFYRAATFVALLLGYAGYYLCRRNLPAANTLLEDTHVLTRSDLGWLATIGTSAYALGKFTTGGIADAKGGRFAFFLGLAGAVLASLLMGAAPATLAVLGAFWALNNYFQSMGWAGLVNVVGRWFPKKHQGTAMGFLSISYQGGGALALAFAGALVARGLGWRALFLVPAVALTGIGAAIFPFLKSSPKDVGYPLPEEEAVEAADEAPTTYLSRLREVFSDDKFLVMCALSFVLTLLRTCFETWLPVYFTDLGSKGAAAILLATAFPILGCAGTLVAGFVSDRWLEGRRAPVMAVFLGGAVLALLGLVRLETLASLAHVDRTALASVLVGATGFSLLGSYSLVGGVAALDFGARRTAGTAAGLLDGTGYLGAALAGKGVADAVQGIGWSGAYAIMAALGVVGVAISCALWNVKPR